MYHGIILLEAKLKSSEADRYLPPIHLAWVYPFLLWSILDMLFLLLKKLPSFVNPKSSEVLTLGRLMWCVIIQRHAFALSH